MQGLAAVEAMAAGDSLRCDEVTVVVLLSVIVATFVLCDEFFLVVFARIMSKSEPDRGSKSEDCNPQQDAALQREPQKRTKVMILSHENVLAHKMALVAPHARHGQSIQRYSSPYQNQDALKCWVAETECGDAKHECLKVGYKCWSSEVENTCWENEDHGQCRVFENASPPSRSCFIYVAKPKKITPADIMARWNLS